MSETKAAVPSKAEFKKLSECRTLGEAFGTNELKELIKATAPSHIEPGTMLRAFTQAAGKSPLIYKCDYRQSLGAFMSLSYLGLVPGTIMQEAHLIPFKGSRRKKDGNGRWIKLRDGGYETEEYYDLNVVIGYPGYIKLAYNSGFIKDLQTGLYMPGDEWREVMGTHKELYHVPNRMITHEPLQKPIAGYAVATLDTGGIVYEVMPWGEVLKIRDRSQGYRHALAAYNQAQEKAWRIPATWTEAPWVRDELEMGRKTLIRRISKVLPRSPQLRAAVAIEDAQDIGRNLDYGPVIDGEVNPLSDEIPDRDKSEPDPVDPGAAYTDRRPAQTRTQQTTPAFEAVLIDQYGAIASEHNDARRFAAALIKLCEDNPDDNENIIQENADAINLLREMPDIWKLVEPVIAPPHSDPWIPPGDEDGNQDDGTAGEDAGSPLEFGTIDPPMNNGKPSWPVWASMMRGELADLTAPDLIPWLNMQRGRIEESQMAQRAAVVKSITERFATLKVEPPSWLGDSIAKNPAAQLTQEEKDARWVEDQMAAVGKLPDTAEGKQDFDKLVAMDMFTTVMARLKRDNEPMYTKLNNFLGAKYRALSKKS